MTEQPVKLTNAERLAALEESRSTMNAALDAVLAELRGQNSGLEAKLEESRTALAEVRGQSAGLEAKLEESRTALAEVRGQSAGLEAKLEESRTALADVRGQNAGLQAKLEESLTEVRGQSAGLQAKLEESRGAMDSTIAEVRGQSASLRATAEAQRQQIEDLTARVQGLDRLVKEQNAFMDELEKDMKEAFKNNGRTVTSWLEEKDRQFAALQGSSSMEGRVAQLEELVRRLQYRVATR
jgi:chromosome segregation ATPase